MRNLFNAIFVTVASATSAFAASGAREDNSGFFVWAFLGLCALIVVGQLVPAVMMMLGFAKGMAKEPKEAVSKVS